MIASTHDLLSGSVGTVLESSSGCRPAFASRHPSFELLVGVAVDCRGLRGSKNGTRRALPCSDPTAVLVDLLEEVVDPRAERVIVVTETDAVRLFGERLADDLELASVLVGEAGQDDVVGGHSD